MNKPLEAIDWNNANDPKDVETWNLLIKNFWTPEKVAVSNDLPSWATLTKAEKELTKRVFVGLTMLDTMQGETGAYRLMADAEDKHEIAVMSNITFMEEIHAKSYSSIFATLCSTEEIRELFRWAKESELLQKKANIINQLYLSEGNDLKSKAKRKIASVFLESFLFYSGFYLPLYWSSRAKLTNTADIIRLIVRDETIHGYYIGYNYQKLLSKMTESEIEDVTMFAYNLLTDLYEVESLYTAELYDDVGLTEEVKTFIRYNGNKALQNLGLDPLFPEEDCQANPAILAALGGEENHDFFSGAGSTYKIITVEATTDEDWA